MIYYRAFTWVSISVELLIFLMYEGTVIILYRKQSPRGLLWFFMHLKSHTPGNTLTCHLMWDILWLTLTTQQNQKMGKRTGAYLAGRVKGRPGPCLLFSVLLTLCSARAKIFIHNEFKEHPPSAINTLQRSPLCASVDTLGSGRWWQWKAATIEEAHGLNIFDTAVMMSRVYFHNFFSYSKVSRN